MKIESGLRACLMMAFCVFGLESCGSDSSNDLADGALPGHETTTIVATVTMPTGVNVLPDTVKVLTSVGSATPDSSGAVTLGVYANAGGAQLAIVLSPTGSPMLMGWLDATHTEINVQTTADVLAYFALGGATMLRSADAQTLIKDIPSATGLSALEAVIEAQLTTSADAFENSNAALTQALSTFATAIYTGAAAVVPAGIRARVHASLIQPAEQSGITVQEADPFTAYLTNNFRRRAYAYVDRVSYTLPGSNDQIPDQELALSQFAVPAVVGLTGGVTGTLTDIISAYYGLQPTAWGPITAPDSGSFPVPLVSGSATTTYQVTVVGAGANLGVSGRLRTDQAQELTSVSIEGFVLDFFIPTVANIALGSGQRDFDAGAASNTGKLFAAVGASFITDITPAVMASDTITGEITTGQWKNAARDLTAALGGLNALQTLIVKAIEIQVPNSTPTAGTTWLNVPFTGVFTAFNKYMSAAGGVLQAFDSGKYASDIASSDQADQWTIVESNATVKLNPPTNIADVGSAIPLTATVLSADSQAGYSYWWTLASSAKGGDLSQIGGNQTAHLTQYCSSGNQTLWVYESGETSGDVDTVTVQVYSESNCASGKGMLLGTGVATVTFTPTATVTVSPTSAMLSPGGTQSLTAALTHHISASDGTVTYQWSVSGSAGGLLTDPATGAGTISYTSSSATATYTAATSAVSPQQDSVAVTAFLVQADPASQTKIGNAAATITFGNPWVGTWVGSTVSTCGYYSGPQTFNITQINATTLDFGPYDATFSGNSASVNNGEVVFTLSGNTIKGYEADSCQTGTYTRQ
jgi:hypothetical protein